MATRKHQTIHLPVVIEEDEDGMFIATCPVLRGCRSYGETVEEALRNVREAMEMCLEDDEPRNRFVGVHDIEMAVDA